jgi:hypothetical protein
LRQLVGPRGKLAGEKKIMPILRALIAIFPLWFATMGSAQAALRVFTSPDGAFRFKYSPLLVDCTKLVPTKRPSSDVPKVFLGKPPALSVPDSCMSQGPMCVADESVARTVACYAYPKEEFKNKPTFIAATFFVAEISGATESVCLQGSKYWDPNSLKSAKVTNINGIPFKVFEVSDGWAGGGQCGSAYRVFHENKCYELGIQTANENSGAFDPGTFEEFTKRDGDKVQRRLREPLNTFVFMK